MREPQLSKITYNISLLILTGGYIPTLATFFCAKASALKWEMNGQNERPKGTTKKNE
jgi:hypothetical protein